MRIVLTGASYGIGRHLATDLVADGHQVWAIARSQEKLDALAAELGENLRVSAADVADYRALAKVADEVKAAWGGLDGIIANAGIQGEVGPAMEADPEAWSHTVRVNLDGTFYTVRAFYALLEGARRGKVMCFSGGGATSPRPFFTGYGIAKAGVVRLVETLAEEWEGQPVDITAIAPGAINTRLLDEVLSLGPDKVGKKEFEAATKRKEAGGAPLEGVTRLIRWLLSEASDGISGKLISAVWDGFEGWPAHKDELVGSDLFTLRRIMPKDRGGDWQ